MHILFTKNNSSLPLFGSLCKEEHIVDLKTMCPRSKKIFVPVWI